VVIGLEDAVRQKVGAQELPDLLDGVQLRRTRRQQDRRDVLRPDEIAGDVPARTVEQQHGMGALGDVERYLVDVELHRLGVGPRQREACADASLRADRAEEIRAFVALVGGLAGPRSPARPLPQDTDLLADLLADPRLVPRLRGGKLWNQISMGLRRAMWPTRYVADMGFERAREVFLKASMVRPSCIGCRGRALM
jgi:hypothetical protein